MHIISDLQRRPNKSRLRIEKSIVPFYDLCSLAQLICYLIYTTSFLVSSKRTFANTIWGSSDLKLVASLEYKTSTCSYETTRDTFYAFNEVGLVLTKENVNNIFADLAIQMRLTTLICGAAFLMGILNRLFVENNLFFFEWRNFILHKDLLSAVELAFLFLGLRTVLMARDPSFLLVDYLHFCRVKTHVFLPFVSLVPIYLFVAVGFFTYLVGLVLYLGNALPKYGIMTEDQIADYKVWLRNRRIDLERARVLKEEARQASMRLNMMLRNSYDAHSARARGNTVGQDPLSASMGFAMPPSADHADHGYTPRSTTASMSWRRTAPRAQFAHQ